MQRAQPALLLIATAVTALALSGCATSWTVDSQVRSYSHLETVSPAATYRFDRLPSQQAHAAAQSGLEAMAAPALEAAGLRRDDANARYAVQLHARVTLELSPWADPWYYPPGSPDPSLRWRSGPWGPPLFTPPGNPWYQREVGIVMRELPSNRVVYETRARNEGPYNDSRDMLPVMFHAAMQGFPHPPPGERQVDLVIPPKGSERPVPHLPPTSPAPKP